MPEHQNLAFGELCKRVSPRWAAMTAEQKQPFVTEYEQDRVRYLREKASLSEEDQKTLRRMRRERKRRNRDKPKSALSSFMLFVVQTRPAIVASTTPPMTFRETGRVLGQKWRALSEDERAPFVALAAQDRDRFVRETHEYDNGASARVATAKAERDARKQKRAIENSVVNGIRDAINASRLTTTVKKIKKPIAKRSGVAMFVADKILDIIGAATPPTDVDLLVGGDGMPVSQTAFINKAVAIWQESPSIQTRYTGLAEADSARYEQEFTAYTTMNVTA